MENGLMVKVQNVNGVLVVSSRVIAEQLGKEHSKVIRSLEQLLTEPNVASLIILNEYKDKKGEMRKEYLLTQDGFTLYMFNIQGYNDFKIAYINEFNRMKQQLSLPKTFAQALRLAAEQQEEIERLAIENKVQEQQILEMQPKVLYHDLILQCKNLLSTTMIAKDYGMSAKAFNKLLHNLNVQYKQGGIWFLYQEHAIYGYTQTKTTKVEKADGTVDAMPHTYWTQKGRLFLYDLLKKNGVLPLIEQECL